MPTNGALLPSLNLVRVYATWVLPDGSALVPGSYVVSLPRLTATTDDRIIPAGKFLSGTLNSTTTTLPSLDIMVPATDDPDVAQSGNWQVTVKVTLTPTPGGSSVTETYVIDVPLANRPTADGGNGLGVDLLAHDPVGNPAIATPVATYAVGVPGGLAKLSTDGLAVLDAFGNPVTGSGGTGGGTWSTLGGKPAALSSLTATATQADVRNAIAAAAASDVTTLSTAVAGKADSSSLAAYTPTTRTVNGHALSANVVVTASDVGAKDATWTPTINDLPAGSQLAVSYDAVNGWPARPTARTDIVVVWYGGTVSSPPTAAVDGDQWVRPLS